MSEDGCKAVKHDLTQSGCMQGGAAWCVAAERPAPDSHCLGRGPRHELPAQLQTTNCAQGPQVT